MVGGELKYLSLLELLGCLRGLFFCCIISLGHFQMLDFVLLPLYSLSESCIICSYWLLKKISYKIKAPTFIDFPFNTKTTIFEV